MKTRSAFAPAAALLLAASCGSSVTVSHLEPAPYDLGPARRLVLVEVGGALSGEKRVTRSFLEQVAGESVFSIQDATREGVRLASLGSGAAPRGAKDFRRNWPADVYVGLGVELQSHSRHERRKTAGWAPTHDAFVDVEVVRYFVEVECELRVRLLDAKDGRELAAFTLSRSGVSSKDSHETSDMRGDAEDRAIENAVADAVSQFTRRRP